MSSIIDEVRAYEKKLKEALDALVEAEPQDQEHPKSDVLDPIVKYVKAVREFRRDLPACPVCEKKVSLETANTDEYGQAIHEDCYLVWLNKTRAKTRSKS